MLKNFVLNIDKASSIPNTALTGRKVGMGICMYQLVAILIGYIS